MKRLIAAVALAALATPTALARSEVLDFDASAALDICSDGRVADLTSATQFRCVTGNIVASVGLSGTVVSLRK